MYGMFSQHLQAIFCIAHVDRINAIAAHSSNWQVTLWTSLLWFFVCFGYLLRSTDNLLRLALGSSAISEWNRDEFIIAHTDLAAECCGKKSWQNWELYLQFIDFREWVVAWNFGWKHGFSFFGRRFFPFLHEVRDSLQLKVGVLVQVMLYLDWEGIF